MREEIETVLSLAKTPSLDSKKSFSACYFSGLIIQLFCRAGIQKNPEPCAVKTSILPPNCVSASDWGGEGCCLVLACFISTPPVLLSI